MCKAGLTTFSLLLPLPPAGGCGVTAPEEREFLRNNSETFVSGTGPLGAKVALPPEVTKTLEDEKQVKPLLSGNISYAVQIRAGRRSDIEGVTPLLEDQTILTISCAGKPYRITTRPRDFSEGIETQATIQWSYQSCGDVTLTVYFYLLERERRFGRERKREEKPPATETTKRIQLTKRYPGSAGFLRFLQDFATGGHRFEVGEFDPDPEAGAILQEGVNGVNVYYSVTVPPQLTKLTAMLQSAPPPNESPLRSEPVT
jgi:hypothetical protein